MLHPLFFLLAYKIGLTLGQCNVTILEELPAKTVIPLSLGEGDLTLIEGQEYFRLVKSPSSISNGFFTGPPIWLDRNVDLYTNDQSWNLEIKSPIDREKLCVIEPNCDCAAGNSDPRYNSARGCHLPLRYSRHSPDKGLEIIPINVCIADINDNAPIFPGQNNGFRGIREQVFELNIEEETPINTLFPLPQATDADAGPVNDIKDYSYKCSNANNQGFEPSAFRLKFDKASRELHLQVLERLDLEDKKSQRNWPLECILTASDSVHSVSNRLVIALADINDHAPQFLEPVPIDSRVNLKSTPTGFDIRIPEDLPAYTHLLTFKASDADSNPEYNQITYESEELQSQLSSTKSPIFRVDRTTGVMKLNSALSYVSDSEPAVVIKIRAIDKKGLSSEITCRIFIKDINNHPPDIELSGEVRDSITRQPSSYLTKTVISLLKTPIRVQEESSNKMVLAIFKVTDADSKDNGNVTCNLVDDQRKLQDRVELKRLAPDLWGLTALGPIDREKIKLDSQDLRTISDKKSTVVGAYINCKDNPQSGEQALEHRLAISIAVEDINDNAPQFLPNLPRLKDDVYGEIALLNFQVVENAPNETDIGRISDLIIELDKGDDLIYELSDLKPSQTEVRQLLQVMPHTGVIRTLMSFDREQYSFYDNILLTVKDASNNPHTIHARINLTVLDVNDNKPQFLDEESVVRVPEDVGPDHVIAKINVTDRDLGDNGTVLLKLAQRSHTNFFRLRENELILFPGRKLDREQEEQHQIVVLAIDQGLPYKLTSSATYTVMVEDVNDNRPLFPTTLKYKSFQRPCSSQGTFEKIEAEDKDPSKEFSQINYKILNITDSNSMNSEVPSGLDASDLFDIEPNTGLLNYHDPNMSCGERIRVLYLHILAYDPQNEAMNDTIKIKVILNPDQVAPRSDVSGDEVARQQANSGESRGPRSRAFDVDGTIYGVVILVCVSVGLCIFLLVLLVYFRKKFVADANQRMPPPDHLMNGHFRPANLGNVQDSFVGIHQNMLVKDLGPEATPAYSKLAFPDVTKTLGYNST
ncbi:putative calcium-dependent cell-adhesion protein, partial [Cichlidogyrus casuarinus]